MVQIFGALVLVVATLTLIHVLIALFRVRKRLGRTSDPAWTDRVKLQQ